MSVPPTIGRYRVGPRLGAGGYAVVWLAYDDSLDTTIAIKVMAENWVDQVDLRDRFLAEAQMLRRASSSRIVQVFDIGELPDGRPYFVMEHADRGTLGERIAQGRPPLVEALRLTAEVARGAAELHRLGIVHRDLKPSNVLIRSAPDGGERLLIADLGVAKNMTQGTAMTMSVGSLGYMAPEQSMPDSWVDARADVYSLGALCFHLITGQRPGTWGPVLPPEGSDPSLPEQVRQVLRQVLEPDRDRRWPDATTLARRLDELADEFEARPRPGSMAHSTSRSGSMAGSGRERSGLPGWVRDRRVMLAAGLAIVILGGAGVWIEQMPRTGDQPSGNAAADDPAVSDSTPSAMVSQVAPVPALSDGAHEGLLKKSGRGKITVELIKILTGEAETSAKCREDFGRVRVDAVCRVFYVEKLESSPRTLPVSKTAEITYTAAYSGDELLTLAVGKVARLSVVSRRYQLGQLFSIETKNGVVSSVMQVRPPCKDIDGIVPNGEIEWTSKCVLRSD